MKTKTCPICGISLEQETATEQRAGFGSSAYSAAELAHFRSVHPDFWSWEQRKARLGLGLGFVAAALSIISLIFLFASLRINIGPAPFLIIGLAAFVLPVSLIWRRGAGRFKAEWQLEGKAPQPTIHVEERIDSNIMTSDYSILNLTNNLSKQLELPLTFSSLLWQDSIPVKTRGGTIAAPIPADGALFRKGTVYLAEEMEGRLSVDDWTPLIASALINYRGLRPQKTKRLLTFNVPVIALYILGWFLLPPFFSTTTSCANGQCAVNNFAWDVLIILLPVLMVVLIVVNVVMMLRFRWVADKVTARIFGTDRLINSLRRVSEVSPGDNWNVQKRIGKLTQTQAG